MAQAAVDKLTVSYVVRHLGFAEMAAGRLDGARELPEQSVRLRRRSGTPGVAAGCSHCRNWPPGPVTGPGLALLDEATAIAAEAGARGDPATG